MKKKSIAARLGIAAMALTLITTSLSSGTLAKYTTAVSGSATMKVARWNVGATTMVGGKREALADSTLNMGTLMDTITNKPTNVASGTIAPGMSGTFEIDLTTAFKSTDMDTWTQGQETQVDTDFVVYVLPENYGNLPQNFTMSSVTRVGNGEEVTKDKFEFQDPNGSPSSDVYDTTYGNILAKGTIPKNTNGQGAYVKVNWSWPYEASANKVTENAQDTADGKSPLDNKFTFYVIFTQAAIVTSSSGT